MNRTTGPGGRTPQRAGSTVPTGVFDEDFAKRGLSCYDCDREMKKSYRYRLTKDRKQEMETHQWLLLFVEFLGKLQSEF